MILMNPMMRKVATGSVLALGLAAGGCMSRRVVVTSTPPGATVYANDVELGRTPLEAQFTYYGSYDVLVQLDGFEPLRTKAKATAPVYEYPPLDLAASAVPGAEHVVRWHFNLEPALETRQSPQELEAGLMERARGVRAQVEPSGDKK